MGLSVTFLRSSSPNHRSAAALTFTLSTPYRHHECNCLRKTETQIGSGVLCLRLGSLSDKSTFAQLPNFSPQSPKPFLPPSAPSVYVCACSCRLCYAFRFLGGPPSSPRQKTIGSSSRATRVNLCLLHLRNGGNTPHPPYRPLFTLYWPHCFHPNPRPTPKRNDAPWQILPRLTADRIQFRMVLYNLFFIRLLPSRSLPCRSCSLPIHFIHCSGNVSRTESSSFELGEKFTHMDWANARL